MKLQLTKLAFSDQRRQRAWLTAALVVLIVAALTIHPGTRPAFAQSGGFVGPTSSQPLALSAGRQPAGGGDNNSVSIVEVSSDPALLGRNGVGQEPNKVAVLPDGSNAYVANTGSG